MMGGWISGNRELVMPIRLLDVNEHVHRVEANIDTGFNGHLTLPPDLLRLLSLVAAKPLDLRMANDATESFPTFRGIVLWRNQRRTVRIIESEGTPLIGTALLWDSLLTAEMTDHGAVTIGPLPAGVSG